MCGSNSTKTISLNVRQAESGDWEDCLDFLGEEPLEERNQAQDSVSKEPIVFCKFYTSHYSKVNIRSAISLLRGRAFLALENRTKASYWFKEALRIDAYCYEAFEHLVDLQMISQNESNQIFPKNSLTFPSQQPSLPHSL